MAVWICAACGVEHAESAEPPDLCAICVDERQYVPVAGQRWFTLDELAAEEHDTEVSELEPGVYGLRRGPSFGIGQRSVLVRTPAGNLLWDPPNYFDEPAREAVAELGGIDAIAASHPHMFGSQVSWSRAFGSVPVWVNAADEHWLRRRDPAISVWSDRREVLPGVTLIQCGGHFPGSAVAHFAAGAEGRGTLLTGDTIAAVPAQGWVTFLRSFPNLIPLSAGAVERLVARLEPYPFERLFSLNSRSVDRDAKNAVRRSAERYIGWIRGDFDADT